MSKQVKSFLQSIRSERLEIEYLSNLVEELRTSLLPSAIRYDKISVQTSPDPDPMTDIIAKIDKYEQKIRQNLEALISRYNEATELVMSLDKTEHRQVLYLYYLSQTRLTWINVADKMDYSEQRIYQLHNEAIDILQRAENERLE